MIEMLGRRRQVGARRHPCNLAEVEAQMRLVIVAARHGKVGPVHPLNAAQPRQCVLETPHAVKRLRRDSNLLMKELRHPPLAHPDLFCHAMHTPRCVANVELAGHVHDRRMQILRYGPFVPRP
jgi:hypothetical protein